MDKIIEEDVKRIKDELNNFRDRIKGNCFLVTGGAGFIGSWFCDILNEFGAEIICVDNFSTGSEFNIKHLIKNKNFQLVNDDVINFSTDRKLDYIIHMASIASPPIVQNEPIQTLDANVIGIRKMLELARGGIKGFLFTSTSEVYGNPPDSQIPEKETYYGNVNCFGPRSMYDEGKRCGEAYCYSYWKKFGAPIRIVRIFNTYGPRLDVKSKSQYGRVLVKFIWQALNNQPITIHGNGQQTRSFCYITDQIIGLFKLLLTPHIDGEVVNIGNDKETTILDLANIIVRLSHSSSKIALNTKPDYDIGDDPIRRCPDTSKAKELLNFQPKVSLDEGLEKTITWIKTEMSTK
jgi:UDP-glucuronate decarboxylase